MLTGSIGLLPSAALSTPGKPGLYEPVHGSAPDIAGQGKADPTAAVLSVSMLLAHIGEQEAAAKVEQAVSAELAGRGPKQPGSTAEIGERLVAAVAG